MSTPTDSLNLPPELQNLPGYKVTRLLGRGGMGEVYLARNEMMDREEVLKVINKTFLTKPGALDRFMQEIRNAAKLQHQNIVTAFACVPAGEFIVFAMEYIPGRDLSQIVRAKGPMQIANACLYTQMAARGLQHAHEKKMVHRDIKPSNLILYVDETRKPIRHTVKVLDFGLAKATSEKPLDGGLTGEGQMLGTPDYIAPEQSMDAANADIRSDIYSLGCTLYYLLSGRPPYQESSLLALLQAHHQKTPKSLTEVRSDVSPELAALVTKMMAKDPNKRFQTPQEIVTALTPFIRANAVKAGSAADLPIIEASLVEPAEAPSTAAGLSASKRTELKTSDSKGASGSSGSKTDIPTHTVAEPMPVFEALPVAPKTPAPPPPMPPTLPKKPPSAAPSSAWNAVAPPPPPPSGPPVQLTVPVAAPPAVPPKPPQTEEWWNEPATSPSSTGKSSGGKSPVGRSPVSPREEIITTTPAGSKLPLIFGVLVLLVGGTVGGLFAAGVFNKKSPDTGKEIAADKDDTDSKKVASQGASNSSGKIPPRGRIADVRQGYWRIESGELIKDLAGPGKLTFGDASWQGYEFSTDIREEKGTGTTLSLFEGAIRIDLGSNNRVTLTRTTGAATELTSCSALLPKINRTEWYTVKVAYTSQKLTVTLSQGNKLDSDNYVGLRTPTGRVAFETSAETVRFRNPKVASASIALWEGMPDITGPRKQAPDYDDTGFVSIFDGTTTNGWLTYTMGAKATNQSNASWAVRNGAMTGEGGPGMLMTRQTYKSFVARIRFQLGKGGSAHFTYLTAINPIHAIDASLEAKETGTLANIDNRVYTVLTPSWGFGNVEEEFSLDFEIRSRKIITRRTGSDEILGEADLPASFTSAGQIGFHLKQGTLNVKSVAVKDFDPQPAPVVPVVKGDNKNVVVKKDKVNPAIEVLTSLFNGKDISNWNWTTKTVAEPVVVEGVLEMKGGDKPGQHGILLSSERFTNFQVKFEVLSDSPTTLPFLVRATTYGDRISGTAIALGNAMAPGSFARLENDPVYGYIPWQPTETKRTLDPKQWHRWDIAAAGGRLTAKVDGLKVGDWEIANMAIQSGSFGLVAPAKTNVKYRKIEYRRFDDKQDDAQREADLTDPRSQTAEGSKLAPFGGRFLNSWSIKGGDPTFDDQGNMILSAGMSILSPENKDKKRTLTLEVIPNKDCDAYVSPRFRTFGAAWSGVSTQIIEKSGDVTTGLIGENCVAGGTHGRAVSSRVDKPIAFRFTTENKLFNDETKTSGSCFLIKQFVNTTESKPSKFVDFDSFDMSAGIYVRRGTLTVRSIEIQSSK